MEGTAEVRAVRGVRDLHSQSQESSWEAGKPEVTAVWWSDRLSSAKNKRRAGRRGHLKGQL